MERLTKFVAACKETLIAALWCHRTAYAALAAVYGAGCLGLVEKEIVSQVATALYVALSAQRH